MSVNRMSLASLLALLAAVAFGASSATAAAATPNWRIFAVALPSQLPPGPGGNGEIELNVQNIGDAPSNPGESLTVVDRLPAGVIAKRAGALVSRGEGNELEIPGPWGECAGAGTETVTCTYEGGAVSPLNFETPGPAYTNARGIGIEVESVSAAAGETLSNEATISGGGAPSPASDVLQVPVGVSPRPFGPVSEHEWATNVDGSPDTQAGSHPYELTTSMMFPINAAGEPIGEFKDVHVDLPAGFVGNPNATPRCRRVEFDRRLNGSLNAVCPADSQVGTILAYIEPNQFVTLAIYNLVPPAGVPAQLGFAGGNKIGFLNASVKTGGSYALSIDARDLPQSSLIGTSVSIWGNPSDASHNLERLAEGEREPDGIPVPYAGTPKPFLSLAGACGAPQVFGVSVDSWQTPLTQSPEGEYGTSVPFDSTDESGNPAILDGCGILPFQPSLSVKPESSRADSPTGLTTELSFPQPESTGGVAEADVKDATVTFPAGLTVNPSSADGLQACSESQIGFEPTGGKSGDGFEEFNPEREPGVKTPLFTRGPAQTTEQEEQEGREGKPGEPARCPNASKLGTVEVVTPLIDHPLLGALYLAKQSENPFGSMLALYITVDDPITGIVVKLPGEVSLNPVTGQISTIVDQDPQLPFSSLKIVLFGGEGRARLTTPATCGSYTALAALTPWSGTKTVTPYDQFETTEAAGGGSGSCPTTISQEPNDPGFSAGVFSPIAGSYSPFTLELSREDGSQTPQALSVTLPPGLLGKLAGVEECPQAGIEAAQNRSHEHEGAIEAEHPSCPSGSELGVAHVGVGSSSGSGRPLYVTGHAYLAGPYEGAPFSIVVITPAVAGPFDLGTVVVRSALFVNRETAQVSVKSDPFPHILDGLPLDIRSIAVEVTRPQFTLNPTSCEQMPVTGTIASTQGADANVSSPFKVGGCNNLPFHPTITASTEANASKAGGASLKLTGASTPGQEANLAKLDLTVPLQLPARLTTLQKACLAATFEANPASCPEASDIGTMTVHTPLLSVPATGPAYLVSHGGAAFPDVEVVLQADEKGGDVEVILDGKTDIKNGVTYSNFETTPDVPFTSFEAVLPTGPHSIFTANLAKGSYNLCGQHLTMPTSLTGQNGATFTQNTPIAVTGACTKPVVKKLTRAELLAKALKACRKQDKRNKARRQKCERTARKRYGPVRRHKQKRGK